MKKISINSKDLFTETVNVLRSGGVVMHPTETCYGLAVDVMSQEALGKLYRIKGRDMAKPVSILVADLKMAKQYGKFSEKALELAKKYWPGPLTIVVPRTKSLPGFFNKDQNFVGIRCANHKFSQDLVRTFGSPITTTSANLSGQKPLYEADLSKFGELAKEIDLVVDGGRIFENKPSTVVKIVEENVEIIRQGGNFKKNDSRRQKLIPSLL